MATEVVLPKSGMGIDEGTILEWHKAIGDRVQQGESLAEIETAKATQPLEAPVSGTLVKILAEPGQSVLVNSVVAVIEESPS